MPGPTPLPPSHSEIARTPTSQATSRVTTKRRRPSASRAGAAPAPAASRTRRPREKAAEVQTAEVRQEHRRHGGAITRRPGPRRTPGRRFRPPCPRRRQPRPRPATPRPTKRLLSTPTQPGAQTPPDGRGVAADEVAPADSAAASTADKPVDVRPLPARARSQQAAQQKPPGRRAPARPGKRPRWPKPRPRRQRASRPKRPKAPETPESSGTPAAQSMPQPPPKEPSHDAGSWGSMLIRPMQCPAAKDTATGIAVGPEGVGSIPGSDDGAAASHKRRGHHEKQAHADSRLVDQKEAGYRRERCERGRRSGGAPTAARGRRRTRR